MKTLIALIFALAGNGLSFAQTCNIPSLRGLKLGMTAQAIDTQFVVDNDIIFFDDVQYKLTFTRNKLVRIDADYVATNEWMDARSFVALLTKKLSLPNEWKFVENTELLRELKSRRDQLLSKYTADYKEIKGIDQEMRLLRDNARPILKCSQFSVSVVMAETARPLVTFRLTNRFYGNGNFEP